MLEMLAPSVTKSLKYVILELMTVLTLDSPLFLLLLAFFTLLRSQEGKKC